MEIDSWYPTEKDFPQTDSDRRVDEFLDVAASTPGATRPEATTGTENTGRSQGYNLVGPRVLRSVHLGPKPVVREDGTLLDYGPGV
jgi:hypothetical protein